MCHGKNYISISHISKRIVAIKMALKVIGKIGVNGLSKLNVDITLLKGKGYVMKIVKNVMVQNLNMIQKVFQMKI